MVVDDVLGSSGVDQGSLQLLGQRDDLRCGAAGALAVEDHRTLGGVDGPGRLVEGGVAGNDRGVVIRHRNRQRERHLLLQHHIGRDRDVGDAPVGEGGVDGDVEHLHQILWSAGLGIEEGDVVEQLQLAGLLRHARADPVAVDLSGDRKHRDTVARGVGETVQQVVRSRALAGAGDGELAGDSGLPRSHEGGVLLVAADHELDVVVLAETLHQGVDGVARNAVDAVHTDGLECVEHLIADCPAHRYLVRCGWIQRGGRRPAPLFHRVPPSGCRVSPPRGTTWSAGPTPQA